MSVLAIAIGCCLVAQGAADTDPHKPKLVPRRAPAASLDAAAAPAASAAPPRSRYSQEPALGPAGADNQLRIPDEKPLGDSEGESNEPLGQVGHQKSRPPDLLAEALATPQEEALVGKPLDLVAALSHSTDRQQQLKIAQAYWRLSTAQADYHWAVDQRNKLAHYTKSHTGAPGTLSARAAARADVRDTQLAVVQAQQELADLVGSGASETLPLASDRPHVGDYRTYYETIFNNRTPAPRIRLIHRTLSVRRKAIDAHGEAIVAAGHALEDSGAEFQTSGQGLPTLLAAWDQLKKQRRAFMATVRDYNNEIAEYLFAVAPPGTSDKTLVSKLILNSERGAAAARSRSNARDTGPAENEAPGEAAPPADGGSPAEPDQPAVNESADAEPRTVRYQRDESLEETGLYQALLEVNAPARVQKLSGLLHWDRSLPSDTGQPTPLADCLRSVAAQQRLAVVAAYWRTRERAARYQVLNDQFEQLNALSTVVIGKRGQQGMAEAGVRLQAARLAAQASVLEAHVALLNAEFELTQSAGRRVEDPWLLPATPPQSGRYVVGGADAPGGPGHHWGKMVTLRHGELEERADAVIRADALRAELVNETRQTAAKSAPHAGRAAADQASPLDRLLWAIARQTDQTLTFLHELTDYNSAIARYVLAILPPGTSNDELVKKLVIARTARGES
jgi:hypothetical protein